MTNIVLTDSCTRRCPYCFAAKKLKPNASSRDIDFKTLIEIADFLERSGSSKVHLVGGEPTLHPDFALFLDYLLGRGFRIRVFTNAMIRARTLSEIRRVLERHVLSPARLRFVVNVNEAALRTRGEWQLQTRAFRSLGKLAVLSYNIHHADASFDFLADIIERYEIQPYVRFGLAAPVPGRSGAALAVPSYRRAIDGLIDFVRRRCLAAGIAGSLDCGFPLCFFDDEALGTLFRAGVRLRFSCGPAIDIDAEKKVWYCFPLADVSTVDLGDFPSLRAIAAHFREMSEEHRRLGGILPECVGCTFRARGLCAGGCLAHVIDRVDRDRDERARSPAGP